VIFVTVGTQLPFERLVAAVDEWAARQLPPPDVLAQVGSGRVDYPHVRCVRSLDGRGYAEAIAGARLLVAHAGTGSILTALDCGVPVILLPRDAARGEHRDDHQMQTARQMERMGLVKVAWNELDLASLIDREMAMPCGQRQPRVRNDELVRFVGDWVRSRLGR
jgi:UDP-N-acetylglucosamine transferase subunit ALG13